MESSEKIITNCDILLLIFDYLDFKEHLKLIKLCPQFEYATAHGVWRLRCKNRHVLQTFPDTSHLQYNPINNVKIERSLTTETIQIILHHSSKYIRKLEFNDIRCLKNIISLKYHLLTELLLRGIFVEDTLLQQVAENCLNLQSFSLKKYAESINQTNIHANVFGEMKALNKMEIYDMKFTAWNYFDVQQLFYLGHLKTLMINIEIGDSSDNKGNNNNSTDCVFNIENLTIGALPCLQSAIVCFIEDLIRFKNLTKLSIRLQRVSIDGNDLTQTNNACLKLCELSFAGCYLTFKEFPCMNNLKHLTFKCCENRSLKNYDEIFRKLKLKSLTLVRLRMGDRAKDIFHYNYTLNTLETLNIQDIADRNIVTTFCNQQNNLENVSKVRLLESYYGRSQQIGLCFSHNLPNLQELIMNSFFISLEDILYLEHLKILQFDLFYSMTWSYLEILFQHPTLTHITITPFHCRDFKKYCEHFPISCEGLTTTLEYLSLPSVVYERGLSFWQSFRQRNNLLKLEIVDCDAFKSSAAPM